MADVKTRAYYAPYDNDYYVPDAEGAKRTGKNENWRDIEKGFYLVQAKNDEQDGQFADIEAKDEEQDGRLDAIEAKDVEQDGRLDAIEAVNTQQNLDIQTNRNNITALDTRLTSAESLLDAVSQTSVENSAAIAQLQTDQQTLSDRLDTTNAQLADNSTRLTRAESNIVTLQSESAQASQDITALQGRATAAESDIDTLDASVAALQGDITALQGRATASENDIDALESAQAQIESDITTLDVIGKSFPYTLSSRSLNPGVGFTTGTFSLQNVDLPNGRYSVAIRTPYITAANYKVIFSLDYSNVGEATVNNGVLTGPSFGIRYYNANSEAYTEQTLHGYIVILRKLS